MSAFDTRELAWAALHHTRTTAQDLADIAGRYPEFASTIATHPSAYPELRDWARSMSQDPDATASRRLAPAGAAVLAATTPQALLIAPTPAGTRFTLAPGGGASGPMFAPPMAGTGFGAPPPVAPSQAPDHAARRKRVLWWTLAGIYAVGVLASALFEARYRFESFLTDGTLPYPIFAFLEYRGLSLVFAVLFAAHCMIAAPRGWRKAISPIFVVLSLLQVWLPFVGMFTGMTFFLALAYFVARPIRGAGWAALPVFIGAGVLPVLLMDFGWLYNSPSPVLAVLMHWGILMAVTALGVFMAEALSRGAVRRIAARDAAWAQQRAEREALLAQTVAGAGDAQTSMWALAELQRPPRNNTLAVLSLVFSVLMALPAIVMGHVALAQIARTGESGRGLAIAGLIIGYFMLVVGVASAILYSLVFYPLWALMV
ncbi:DUF4190 domain-containing protein [Leucobacter sp. HY1908]